jgi:HAMP domain-containing protein
MTPNPTKEEIDALEREIQEQREEREKHIRLAVNPGQ